MSVFDDERDILLGPFGHKRNRPKPTPPRASKTLSEATQERVAKSVATYSTLAATDSNVVLDGSTKESTVVKNAFMEDWQKNLIFHYTGKANVIGLSHPDAYYHNVNTEKYLRFATVSYDETIQSKDQFFVDETLKIDMFNSENTQYLSNSFTVHLAAHIVGNRVTKDKCKCIITPALDYTDGPEIYVTEEQDGTTYQLGLWIRSEYARVIYVTKVASHALNSLPINNQSMSTGYYISIPTNNDIISGVDTTNESGTIIANQVCRGISIFDSVVKRFQKLEAIQYPDIKGATINTDMAWVPETEGEEATTWQRVPISSVDYGASLSDTFITIEAGTTKGFRVLSTGLYLIQIVSRFNTKSAIEDIDVEMALFKNDDQIATSNITTKLIGDNGVLHINPIGIGGAQILTRISTTDIMRLQMRFLSGAINGVINEGTTIQITKLIDIPEN